MLITTKGATHKKTQRKAKAIVCTELPLLSLIYDLVLAVTALTNRLTIKELWQRKNRIEVFYVTKMLLFFTVLVGFHAMFAMYRSSLFGGNELEQVPSS